jgi:hypothetical protein
MLMLVKFSLFFVFAKPSKLLVHEKHLGSGQIQ